MTTIAYISIVLVLNCYAKSPPPLPHSPWYWPRGGIVWQKVKYIGRSLIGICMFLWENLREPRDDDDGWTMAWFLKQHQETSHVADVNVVVGEPQPETPQQTAEAAAGKSNEPGRSHNDTNKGNNKGQKRNSGQQVKASHNIRLRKPKVQKC
ncbi:hypothetical protein LY76DRAFT_131403 [Colletotrichum caudatum]|nr:hypothetical protein LY76DRAFT_131403 [Colletotrichum caudatum]